jgi:hypothetical protein
MVMMWFLATKKQNLSPLAPSTIGTNDHNFFEKCLSFNGQSELGRINEPSPT